MIHKHANGGRVLEKAEKRKVTQYEILKQILRCITLVRPHIKIKSVAFFQTFSQTNITKVCPGSQCMFAFYGGESVYHRYILVLHLCNLFMFLWLVNFTIALGQCTLAGAFASYYWALKKPNDIPACPLYSSFSRAIR